MSDRLQRCDSESPALSRGYVSPLHWAVGRAGGKHRGMPSVVRRRSKRIERSTCQTERLNWTELVGVTYLQHGQ